MNPGSWLARLVAGGEGERLEFKKHAGGLAEALSALANTEGGRLLLGVGDDGTVEGANPADEEKLHGALHRLGAGVKARVRKIRTGGRRVLVVEVRKSPALVACGNVAYIRVGASDRALSIDELVARSVESLAARYDAAPTPARLAELDRGAWEAYFRRREELRGIPARGSTLQNMTRLKIASGRGAGRRLTLAGLIFFGRDPQAHAPHAAVRVVDMRGPEPRTVAECRGTLGAVIEKAHRETMGLVGPAEFRVGPARKRMLEYPETAVREAIVNAVAHRNYAIEADVRVFLHRDRLIVRSPGAFPPGVTPEKPEHLPRNPTLCGFLYDTGYIERYGFGIVRMREAVEAHPWLELTIDTAGQRTEVVLRKVKEGPEPDEVDRKILASIQTRPRNSVEVARLIGMSKPGALKRLDRLVKLGVIRRRGRARATTYEAVSE